MQSLFSLGEYGTPMLTACQDSAKASQYQSILYSPYSSMRNLGVFMAVFLSK